MRDKQREGNLIPMSKQPPEIRKRLGSKGGLNSAKVRRERRAMADILCLMMNKPISKSYVAAKKALAQLGITNKDATNGALINLQLVNLALSNSVDNKTKLRAIELIHRFIDGQKLDVTTNGNDIAKNQSDPLQLHIVTSTDEYKRILEEVNKERKHKNSDIGEIED